MTEMPTGAETYSQSLEVVRLAPSSLFACFVLQFVERRPAQLGLHAHCDSALGGRHAEVLARRHHSGSPQPPRPQAVSAL